METRTKKGDLKYSLVNASILPINNVDYVLVIFHDITELKIVTRELLKTEKEIKDLQENVQIGIFRLDASLKLLYANPFARRLLNLKKMANYDHLKFNEFGIGRDLCLKYYRKLLIHGSLRNFRLEIKNHEGKRFYANINLKLIRNEDQIATHIDGTIENITMFRKAQQALKEANREITAINRTLEKRIHEALEKQKQNHAHLVQKSKLESLGELAAGIAHEINQPMGVMSLSLENLQAKITSGVTDPVYLFLKFKSLHENIERIRDIIDQVRTFSRDDPPLVIQKVYLNNCIQNVLKLIGTQYKNHGVKLILDLDESIGFSVGSRISVEQVIMNLLSNSKYAVDEQADYFNDGEFQKQIKIATGQLPGHKVFLEIEDNGVGIEPGTISRVFDPFYTTKPAWKGTGLGLSIVYGILQEMRAEIKVESKPGKFTRFKILFPVFPEKY